MDKQIEAFFDKEYENIVNEAMFNFDYSFPKEEIENYVLSILAIPYSQFIDYVASRYCVKPIVPSEIPQISNYNAATLGICNILNDYNDPGMDCAQIGVQLFTDGKERKDGAYFKFGENHVKGASFHGLTQCCGKKWFLTCLGRIYPKLDAEMRQYLSARTLLRNPFFHIVLAEATKHDVNIRFFMPGLSESTQKRRSSSCMHFFNVILKQCEIEKVPMHRIFFEPESKPEQKLVIKLDVGKSSQFKFYLPLYSIRAACGAFNHDDTNEIEGWVNVKKCNITPTKDMFVVHAEGSSMEPLIHDGDLCIFSYTNAYENGAIMLIESNNLFCQHVIKEFHYKPTLFQEYAEDNNVILHSLNPKFQDIVLSATDNPRIVGKLIKVIHAHEQF